MDRHGVRRVRRRRVTAIGALWLRCFRWMVVFGMVAIALSMSACSGSSDKSSATTTTQSSATTTTTSPAQAAEAERAADAALIVARSRADNDAWNTSRAAGILTDIATSYPPSRVANAMTVADCNRFLNANLWQNTVVDGATVSPQPGWVEPGIGTVPDGRIYFLRAEISSRYGTQVQPVQVQEIHAVVAPDGMAYFFAACKN